MAIPFAVLMEYAASLTKEDFDAEPLDNLAARAGTFPERLADALEAVRICRATPTSIRAEMHPAVRRALDADRGHVASGFMTPDLFQE